MNLKDIFKEKLVSGLKRQSLKDCASWAKEYRIMGKPFPGRWTFDHHPWLREMHNSTAELNIGQKAAQMGYTELLLNWTFYNIDLKGESVLYVLPTDDNAGDFAAGRFDPALEVSEHLNNLFSDVKNTKMKRAGTASLYIRGSRSENKLISVPVAKCALDEVDRMVLKNIPMIWERMSGQPESQAWMISTPTVPGLGINAYYEESSKEHYFFKCPACGRHIELTFPDSIIIADEKEVHLSHLICTKCKAVLKHEEKMSYIDGIWVPEVNDAYSRGFYINQLYSTTVTPVKFARAYYKSLLNPAEEQEFHNQKCGAPHLTEGARVEDTDIEACTMNHRNGDRPKATTVVTMGVDVGKWLHCEIDEWTMVRKASDIHSSCTCKTLKICKVVDFEELEKLILDYGVNYTVIDANPERRKALAFCKRFYGHASMCFYGREQKGREITEGIEMPSITVDRTSWIDVALGRFTAKNKTIAIPMDTQSEYKEHLKNLVKIYEKDKDGNPVAKYINGNRDDHYAHARTYAEIALSMAVGSATSKDMENP